MAQALSAARSATKMLPRVGNAQKTRFDPNFLFQIHAGNDLGELSGFSHRFNLCAERFSCFFVFGTDEKAYRLVAKHGIISDIQPVYANDAFQCVDVVLAAF